nr:DUF4832 domain-containing protein [Flavisolibacter sp.]
AYNNSTLARIGHHNDCFLASSSDYGTYTNPTMEYPYLEQETTYLPMGGETCAINAPRSECTTALLEMRKFHWSYLNLDYHPGVLAEFEADDCFSEIENNLGYRFELISGIFPQNVNVGESMPITLKINNAGFATPYNQRIPNLIMRNVVTGLELIIPMTANPRFWTAGTTNNIVESITLPADIIPGSYNLFIHMPDINPSITTRPEYAIRFANEDLWDGAKGFNDLKHIVNVTASSLGIHDNNQSAIDLTVYPIPADNEVVLQLDGIEDYKIIVYNALGQNVGVKTKLSGYNKSILNTESLSNGVYFISLNNNSQTETRRIIVSH